jgi:hypothetical protein
MRRCSPHRNGVAPGTPPGSWYDPACPRCLQKLRAGLVTGREPAAPPSFRVKHPRWGTVFGAARRKRQGRVGP